MTLHIWEGLLITTAFGALLALSIHCWPASIRRLPYGDPTQVKARMFATCVATGIIIGVFSAIYCAYAVDAHANAAGRDGASCAESLGSTLGFRLPGLVLAFIVPVILVHCVYFGAFMLVIQRWMSLSKSGSESGKSSDEKPQSLERQAYDEVFPYRFDTWLEFSRDVVIAPLTEELVFRCVNIPVLLLAGFEQDPAVAASAAIFSASHIPVILGASAVEAGGQLVYTFVFGIVIGYSFVRTRQFAFVWIAHALCNFYNVPDMQLSPGIIVASIAGIGAFALLFYYLTDPLLYSV